MEQSDRHAIKNGRWNNLTDVQLKWQMGQSDRRESKNGGWSNLTNRRGDRLKRRQIDKGRIEVLTLNVISLYLLSLGGVEPEERIRRLQSSIALLN